MAVAVDQPGRDEQAGDIDRPDSLSLKGLTDIDNFPVPNGDVGALIHMIRGIDHPPVPKQEIILNAAHVFASVQSSASTITSNSQGILLFGRLCVPITVRA